MLDLIPRLSRFFLFLVLATTVAAAPAFAQGGASTSTFVGTVVDTSGAVIPGRGRHGHEHGHGETYHRRHQGSTGASRFPP